MRNGDYELVKAPDDYPGRKYRDKYCYNHHLVWWQSTGSLPKPGYVIHHKDENKYNNLFSNLEEITDAEHRRHHAKGISLKELICYCCGNIFYRSRRNYNAKSKQGQVKFYCTRSCMGKQTFIDRDLLENKRLTVYALIATVQRTKNRRL